MGIIYKKVLEFKRRHPFTIGWRIIQNSRIVEKYINDDEKVIYAFIAQKNDSPFNIFSSAVVVLTSKRILIGRKRVLIGHFLNSITPDMFNDLEITGGLIWGKVYIDTVKEVVVLTNISLDALDEIETAISSFMLEEKKKYADKEIEKEEDYN